MKALWFTFALLACSGLAGTTPPAQVGFMTGPDSAVFVYWVHPDIHCYEQGGDTGAAELNLVPGDEFGIFAVASRFSFPILTCFHTFSVKVNQGDLYPGLPGDQYSPFGYGVYPDDHDTCPSPHSIMSGANALCGGGPCVDEWAENDVFLPNPAGADLWAAFQWADSTPTAPQLRCQTPAPDGSSNVLGIYDGEKFRWSGLDHRPVFRLHLLSMIALDSVRSPNWRRISPANPPPEAFVIRFFAGGVHVDSTVIFRTDTLIVKVPIRDVDSVQVYSLYEGSRGEESASAALCEDRIPPLMTEIIPAGYNNEYTDVQLLITNSGEERLELAMGFSAEIIPEGDEVLELRSRETVTVPLRIATEPGDTGRAVIVLQERTRQYYPQLISVSFPDSGQTDADDISERETIQPIELRLYPNPSAGGVNIWASGTSGPSRVDIYNILGQRVASLAITPDAATEWDDCAAPPGVYFVRMRTDDGCITRRLMRLRR